MGTTCFLISTCQTTKDVIEREHRQQYIAGERHGFDFEYLTMKGSTGYGVMYRQDKDTGRRTYFGIVFKTSRHRTAHRGMVEFCIKEITESMGPVQSSAPKKMLDILDVLAPNPEGYAAQWRQSCRDNLANRVKPRKPQVGERVEYGGVCYTLIQPYWARRGWQVKDDFGAVYRMGARQLCAALRNPVPEKAQPTTEGESK
jgi:hypothetical protein